MNAKKDLQKLLANPTEMNIHKIKIILSNLGFELKSIRGSHYKFFHQQAGTIIIPVHNGKVKRCYLQDIRSKITSRLY